MNQSDNRVDISQRIDEIESRINALRIQYEQYFAGVEKRAPIREQENMARDLRRLSQRKIIQTELRYRFNNLASRFHVYQGMWERLQRNMDEGRFQRHKQKAGSTAAEKSVTENERIFSDYSSICQQCQAAVPSRAQLETFLQQQRDNIQAKYGKVQCQFKVTCENGKPKIKVSLKR
ncbi:MAG: MXAN_5187 C-terminal domain-containing protein [Desulfuromonas sp.]|nr:MXAN_5187 C-terminal domain-containing protein [Desulfuromonas sp.]